MTTVTKPIIKLPPRNKSSCSTNTNYQQITMMMSSFDPQQQSYFISNELFFKDKDNQISDSDIHHLLLDYHLYLIKRERGGGYLTFPDAKIAERVYALFNGYVFENQVILQLKCSMEVEAEGPMLEVRQLPHHLDHNTLYDIFYPFGSLNLCKIISTSPEDNKRALIQYFFKQDSDKAIQEMNNKLFEGKTIQINSASIMNNHNNNSAFSIRYMNQSVSTPTFGTVTEQQPLPSSNGFVDYTNLYVKNLDPTVDNTDLFNLFRRYGRIISARVMTHPQTNLSKGYGFVSFGKPEEAGMALEEMNGYQFRTKPMIVAYHEPKKPRMEKSTSSTTTSFHPPSPTPVSYNTTTTITNNTITESKHPHEVINGFGMNIMDTNVPMQRKMSMSDSNNSFSPPRNSSITSPQFAPRPSLASLASGATIQPAPTVTVPTPVIAHHHQDAILSRRQRRGSIESVTSIMTESSAQVQRQRMTEAVKNCGSYGSQLPDIVDMILSLKRKERSICLFNSDFLKDKINAALEALEICEDEDATMDTLPPHEAHETIVAKRDMGYTKKPRTYTAIVSPPTSPLNKQSVIEDVVLPPRTSKAIPIVAPDQNKKAEIKALLHSLEGKPIHEQKQLLGDQLFPLVKATHVKHAPKITIRLLDTIDLEVLTNIMYDKESLKAHVHKASLSL
ncbi:MAG: hypothetical protein EXX96DRAFT_584615 [Benjaminiella poitrasii]|nr:MAG: hypothetical protein EXX96DRAFT_584615 [Benjaminiella poitrasii]